MDVGSHWGSLYKINIHTSVWKWDIGEQGRARQLSQMLLCYSRWGEGLSGAVGLRLKCLDYIHGPVRIQTGVPGLLSSSGFLVWLSRMRASDEVMLMLTPQRSKRVIMEKKGKYLHVFWSWSDRVLPITYWVLGIEKERGSYTEFGVRNRDGLTKAREALGSNRFW